VARLVSTEPVNRETRLLFIDMESTTFVLEDDAQRSDVELIAVVEVLDHAKCSLDFIFRKELVPSCTTHIEAEGAGQFLCPKKFVRPAAADRDPERKGPAADPPYSRSAGASVRRGRFGRLH